MYNNGRDVPYVRDVPTGVLPIQPNDIMNFHQNLIETGFGIMDNIYSSEEVNQLLETIDRADSNKETFRKSEGLFAIRQFLKEIPETIPLIFNEKLKQVILELFGPDYFAVKSIYFDKPEGSNWYVSYHQDLTISVDQKKELPGFGPWTVKQN